MPNVIIMVVCVFACHREQSRSIVRLWKQSRRGFGGGWDGGARSSSLRDYIPNPFYQIGAMQNSRYYCLAKLPHVGMGEWPKGCCTRKIHQIWHSLVGVSEGT